MKRNAARAISDRILDSRAQLFGDRAGEEISISDIAEEAYELNVRYGANRTLRHAFLRLDRKSPRVFPLLLATLSHAGRRRNRAEAKRRQLLYTASRWVIPGKAATPICWN